MSKRDWMLDEWWDGRPGAASSADAATRNESVGERAAVAAAEAAASTVVSAALGVPIDPIGLAVSAARRIAGS